MTPDQPSRAPLAQRAVRAGDAALAARIGHVADQGRTSLVANAALAAIIAALFAGSVGPAVLAGWCATMAGITLLRLHALRRASRAPSDDARRRTLGMIAVTTVAAGLVWGVTPWLFLGDGVPLDGVVLIMALAGLAAGAIPILAYIWPIYLGYTAAAILPLAAWLFHRPDVDATGLGLMTLVFLGALAAAGHRYASHFREAHELAADLARSTREAEAANRRLQAEIDETVRARDALAHSEERFHTAFEHAPIGMALARADGAIFLANPALVELLGHGAALPQGSRLADLVHAEDAAGFAASLEPLIARRERRTHFDVRLAHADGRTLWTALAAAVVDDTSLEEPYLIVEVQDITESVELSARLQYEASHDALTDLTNRREFERRLERLVRGRRQTDHVHTLCYLDLDRFKVINDSQGHLAGDEVLRQVAGVLHQHVRAGDTIARLGGDEFAVLLEHCSAEDGLRLADGLIRAVNEFRFLWNEQTFQLDLSVGVSEIRGDYEGVTEILRAADTACAAAKETGGGRAHVYRSDDREMQRLHGEIEWLTRLTSALEAGDFALYAQPIVPTRPTDRTGGLHFEVLLRMRGEAGETLLPSAFLPAAERYGLATRIDRWVIRAVFDWFRAHPEHVARVGACAINLSGNSLDDHEFTEQLIEAMRGAPLAPRQLRFEVTETAAISHLSQAGRFMERVESLGCGFALDDFGSGLSSFGYLRSLPVDTLKIDGQFVRDIARDPVDHALVRSINDIGRVLGLATVAEFVADEATLDALRGIGVDYLQGNHLGPAVPIARLFDPDHATADTA